MEQPELIRQVHFDYFAAGADVAITATYQATFEGFRRWGVDGEGASRLMRLSVQLAAEAREQFWADRRNRVRRLRPVIAASIGPYGAFLADGSEYSGDYGLSVGELMDFHRRRMAVLASSDADLLAFETIPCYVEAEALLRLLREFPSSAAWLSFSCCDASHVCHGERFADCAALAEQSDQVVAIGLNCTAPRHVESLLGSARKRTEKLLLAYPNSGEKWDAAKQCWAADSGDTNFAEAAVQWYRAGARIVGGCCRTTPSHISAVSSTIRHTHHA